MDDTMQIVLEWEREKAQNTSDNIQSKDIHWSGMHVYIHIYVERNTKENWGEGSDIQV